jgi:hypothetical protein
LAKRGAQVMTKGKGPKEDTRSVKVEGKGAQVRQGKARRRGTRIGKGVACRRPKVRQGEVLGGGQKERHERGHNVRQRGKARRGHY